MSCDPLATAATVCAPRPQLLPLPSLLPLFAATTVLLLVVLRRGLPTTTPLLAASALDEVVLLDKKLLFIFLLSKKKKENKLFSLRSPILSSIFLVHLKNFASSDLNSNEVLA